MTQPSEAPRRGRPIRPDPASWDQRSEGASEYNGASRLAHRAPRLAQQIPRQGAERAVVAQGSCSRSRSRSGSWGAEHHGGSLARSARRRRRARRVHGARASAGRRRQRLTRWHRDRARRARRPGRQAGEGRRRSAGPRGRRLADAVRRVLRDRRAARRDLHAPHAALEPRPARARAAGQPRGDRGGGGARQAAPAGDERVDPRRAGRAVRDGADDGARSHGRAGDRDPRGARVQLRRAVRPRRRVPVARAGIGGRARRRGAAEASRARGARRRRRGDRVHGGDLSAARVAGDRRVPGKRARRRAALAVVRGDARAGDRDARVRRC